MDAVAQDICLWTPKLVAKLSQSLDPDDALVLNLPRETVKPGEERAVSIGFGIEDDLGLRQSSLPSGLSHYCDPSSSSLIVRHHA
jgi:hypothetical protein